MEAPSFTERSRSVTKFSSADQYGPLHAIIGRRILPAVRGMLFSEHDVAILYQRRGHIVRAARNRLQLCVILPLAGQPDLQRKDSVALGFLARFHMGAAQ